MSLKVLYPSTGAHPMKVVEFLNKDKWIKGHCARDRQGKPVGTSDPEACHFDVLGAINICYPEPKDREAVYWAIITCLPANMKLLCLWNDSVEWETVEAILRKADV